MGPEAATLAPETSVHATAVSIAGRALLIVGPSRSGKSRLALALIAASTPRRPIRLIGDDRIFLARGPAGMVARGHPRIAGFIERRGLGIVAMPFVASAPLAGLVRLAGATCAVGGQDLAALSIPALCRADAGRDLVLAWWERVAEAPERDFDITRCR